MSKISLQVLLWKIAYVIANLWAFFSQSIVLSMVYSAVKHSSVGDLIVYQFFIFIITLGIDFFRKKHYVLLIISIIGDLVILALQIFMMSIDKLDVIAGFLWISWVLLLFYYALFVIPKK